MKAIEGAGQAGFQIEQVLVLVDRQEGGRQVIEWKGYPFSALFTLGSLSNGPPYLTHLSKRRGGETAESTGGRVSHPSGQAS